MTSVVCKVFERILHRTILSFLIQFQALTGCQPSFRPHRPCLSNILILKELIARLMGDGNTEDVAYLDCAKAFASVNHKFFLAKLESFDLCDKVVQRIKCYLK